MKTLHMTKKFAPTGGIETYVLNLLPLLERCGHENVVIYRQEDPRTPPFDGKPIHHVPTTDAPSRDRAHIAEIIHREQPTVIYLHDVYDPTLIKQVAEMVPTVGYVHIFYPICPGQGKLYHRDDTACTRPYGLGCVPAIYLRRCASARHPRNVYRIMQITKEYLEAYRSLPRVIVASTYMRDLMVQNGIEADRVEILPPHFIEVGNELEVASFPPNRHNILFAGRLEYEKGLPYLLEALRLVQFPCRLLIAGDGSLKNEYIRLVEKMGMTERVQFRGWLSAEELMATYERCTVTVMPTIMPEPFGKVGIEAMANGRPVVAFNVGGISDWLKDGYNGFLVPPLDVKQLAFRLNQILSDTNLAAQMGANARKYVVDHYSSTLHVDKLLHILETVVNSG
jgi:glycosyltransferase involved in cell wall biosynthesis